METICSTETSVDFQQTTRHYIPEDSTLYNHRCENLKSYEKGKDYYENGYCLLWKENETYKYI
jgi:hypothetical protein